tara:strand:- start:275 stop:1165 length:891 start_codon:yes stop_codon:yes gene_type:complete
MAIGDIITAARYNNLQSRVETILGTGSGDDGYGQALNSSQVGASTTITASHMSTLYTDIANGRVHQTGTAPTEIAIIGAGSTILDSDTVNKKGVAQFENLTTTLENEKFQIHGTQGTAEAAKTASYTTSWNGTLTHILDVTFSTADHRRQFFNAGGEIRFASNITYVGAAAKTIDWMTMLVNMGTVKMGYTSTSATGSGSGSTLGFHDLTTTLQTLFTKNGTGLYAANNWTLKAKLVGTTQIQFQAEWNDANTGNPNYDEDVLGTVNSTVTQLRATGTYVVVPTPTHTTNGSSNLT